MARELVVGHWRRRILRGLLICLAGAMLLRFGFLQAADAPIRDPSRQVRRYVVSWKEIKHQNVVMQQRDYSCGAAALATILRYHWGDDVTETRVLQTVEKLLKPEDLADRVNHGLTLTDLRKTAVAMKYEAVIGKLEVHELSASRMPLVVAIRTNGYDHFVVERGVVDGWVYLADPVRGNLRLPLHEFAHQWVENAVLVVAKPDQIYASNSRLTIRQEEVDLHALNYQNVRTSPERTFDGIRW